MRKFFATALLPFVTGCASMSADECRSTNWAEVGERDGLNGIPPRIDQYNFQCGAQNVPQQEYLDAWWVGNATYRDRTGYDGGM